MGNPRRFWPTILFLGIWTAGCSYIFPEKPLPVRKSGGWLPVTELARAQDLLGRCVRYDADGSHHIESCPAAIAPILSTRQTQRFDSGQHDMSVIWIQTHGAPGFQGHGGHYHAWESHIHELAAVNFERVRLAQDALQGIDSVCRTTGIDNDLFVVDRAMAGCAVFTEGHQKPAGMPPVILPSDLRTSHRSLGLAKNFVVFDLETTEAPSCEGDLAALQIGLVKLTELCDRFVRGSMLQKAQSENKAAVAERATVQAEIEKRYAQLSALVLDKKELSKREKRQEQKLRQEINNREKRLKVLATQVKKTSETLAFYQDDPYMYHAAKPVVQKRKAVPPPPPPAETAKTP